MAVLLINHIANGKQTVIFSQLLLYVVDNLLLRPINTDNILH